MGCCLDKVPQENQIEYFPIRNNSSRSYPKKEEYNEENLWKAVLCQAMEDATSNSSKRRILHAKKMAIKWFTEDNEDIKIVCQLAGYNHRTVKKSFKELITAHTSTF